ncbi:unnamed protein product [Amoebophrya sp. A25]|nr:unnamed protein product [Amoebophrya sp. A25]|eukprot:GSA25T00000248001.1
MVASSKAAPAAGTAAASSSSSSFNVTPQPVSEPISLDGPTPEGEKQREPLLSALDRDFPAESAEGLARRERILEKLTTLVQEWTHEVGVLKRMMDEESAREAGAKIFLFGSAKLGVLTPNSDCDCVCVVPKHITRDDFFGNLVPKLQEHRDFIQEINPVPEANTPIIEMKIEGVAVDLGFAQLNVPTLKGIESLQNNDLLRGLDEKSVRGIGGNRVNQLVLDLVPNKDAFREALRFVKAWSKARGIASNMLGFFGGITWAILIARVCQLYPNFNGPMVIQRFFRVFSQWHWGWNRPVLLTNIVHAPANSPLVSLRVWDPHNNPHDKYHLMPILTPSFPAMNSTHNVSETTKRVLIAELKRGRQYVDEVFAGRKKWTDVYAKHVFFAMHKDYIRVQLVAKNAAAFSRWEGFIESKLRLFVRNLEQVCPGFEFRPWPEKYDLGDDSKNILSNWPVSKQMFIGVSKQKQTSHEDAPSETAATDFRLAVERFVENLSSMMKQEGYSEGQQDLLITDGKREELPLELRVLATPEVMVNEQPVEGAAAAIGKREAEVEASTIATVIDHATTGPETKKRKKIGVMLASS